MIRHRRLFTLTLFLATACLDGSVQWAMALDDDASPAAGVAGLLATHDRALLADLKAYIGASPDAADVEQAYLVLFEKSIENDWFLDNEAQARLYLDRTPDGPVAPLARIVATMARAEAGEFDRAFEDYTQLMAGLGQPDQEEFAANFAESLAQKAASAGEVAIARQVLQALGRRFEASPTLRQRVDDQLTRLERVDRPAPTLIARDLKGKEFRLSDLRGQYVLVDFWATWSAPSLVDLPELLRAYAAHHGRGFEIVSISLDETVRPLAEFVESRRIPWVQIHNATSGGDPVGAFGISSIPSSFLIDPEGMVIRLDPSAKQLDQLLTELLKAE